MIIAGDNYAYANKITVLCKNGCGTGLAVLTPEVLFLLASTVQKHTTEKRKNYLETTTTTIGGKHPTEMIEGLLNDDDMTLEILHEKFRQFRTEIEDTIYWPNESIKRFKIWTGWFRRGLVFSQAEKGMGGVLSGTMVSIRPSKEEIKHWAALLKGDPRKAN